MFLSAPAMPVMAKDLLPVQQKSVLSTSAPKSVDLGRGIYMSHCASCHEAGGNRVNSKKPVVGSQVLSTLATFKSYLNEPVGTMPHYEHVITDEKMLSQLYVYTKSLRANQASSSKPNEAPIEQKSAATKTVRKSSGSSSRLKGK